MFREVQQFRQPWVWLVLGLVFVLTVADFFAEPNLLNALGSVVIIGAVIWLFWVMKLEVETRPEALHIRYAPFYTRAISYSDIESIEVEPYSLRDYWGWGPRYNANKGWAYTVSGQQGVRLELTSGKSLYLGSHKPDELVNAIRAKR